MKIYKTTDRIRIEVMTELEYETKLIKDLVSEQAKKLSETEEEQAANDKASARLTELLLKSDPDKRVVFIFSPLTGKQKSEVMGKISMDKGQLVQSTYDMSLLAVKYALKGVEGISNADGTPYVLPVKDGFVTEEGIDDMLNMPEKSQILLGAASQFASLNGMPAQILDRATQSPLPNVEVIPSPKV